MPFDDYQWTEDNPAGYGNAMGRYKTQVEWSFLQECLPPAPSRILDIGGGAGRFAVPLARLGYPVTVVDRSAAALRVLRETRTNGIRVIEGDFLKITSDEVYDAVIAIESVLYFVEIDLRALFCRVGSQLRSGRPFIFTGLNSKSWRYQLHRLRGSNAPRYRVGTPAAYGEALRQARFRVAKMRGFHWTPLPVTSDSPAVPVFAAAERHLRLDRWVEQSPWLLVAATRSD